MNTKDLSKIVMVKRIKLQTNIEKKIKTLTGIKKKNVDRESK